jgi:hypothetical protein
VKQWSFKPADDHEEWLRVTEGADEVVKVQGFMAYNYKAPSHLGGGS